MYWSQGIVYCTCGSLLQESEANRGAIQCTSDLLSIQNYVIMKGRLHDRRYGKTTEQRDYHIAHNLRKRCIKRRFQGIQHRFLNDPEFRASQLEHDRTEEVCIQMDELAQKDFSYHMTQAEYSRYIWRTTTRASAILEVSKMAPIIEFFLQLVATERFLVELMTINKKVHK